MSLILLAAIFFAVFGTLTIALALRRGHARPTDVSIVQDVHADAAALDRVASPEKPLLHMALAHHPNTAPETLVRMIRFADGPVLRAIANRPDTAWPVWEALLACKDEAARARAWAQVEVWLGQARWHTVQLFTWQQKRTLEELNQSARRNFAQCIALQPEAQAEFLRRALEFQVTQTLLHDSDELACAVTAMPAWYALALQGGLALIQDEPPPGARLQSDLTFLLDLVTHDLEAAQVADVIVIHLLCEVLLKRLGQIGGKLQRLEAERAHRLKQLAYSTEMTRLAKQIEQVKNQQAYAQTLCAPFVARSPVTRAWRVVQCAQLLGVEANRPLGLAAVVCQRNALGLQRRLIHELVKVALQADVASLRAVGQLLQGVQAAVAQQTDRQVHYQGLLFILRFLQTFVVNARDQHEAFVQRLPPALTDQQAALRELMQAAEVLPQAAAAIDQASGAIGQFAAEYAPYQEAGYAAWLDELRRRVWQVRTVGPALGR